MAKVKVNYIKEIEDKAEECFKIAEAYFKRSFFRADHQYNLRGRTAGFAQYAGILQWNVDIYLPNKDHYLKQTVPHEVAHLISYQVYGEKGTGHGRCWKHVMMDVFGLEPKRTHCYTEGVKKTRNIRKDWVYQCGCRTHTLSTIKHNKMQEGRASYHCIHCNQTVQFVGQPQQKAQKAA